MTDKELKLIEQCEELKELAKKMLGDPYIAFVDFTDMDNMEQKLRAMKKAIENGCIRDTPEMFEAFGIDPSWDV